MPTVFGPALQGVAAYDRTPRKGDSKTPGWTLDTENDWRHDGDFVVAGGKTMPADTALGKLNPFTPDNGTPIQGDVVMVNGIMTDVALQAADLQSMANRGFRVVGIHNATKGMFRDLAQCVGDKLDLKIANNKAVDTAKRVAREVLAQQAPVALCGHSQGALVLSCALEQLSGELLSTNRNDVERTEKQLSALHVNTLGGASTFFPTGPRYTHHYNSYDLVPMLAGRPLGSVFETYPGEKFDKFSKLRQPEELPPWSNGVSNRLARLVDETTHGPRAIYVDRIPAGREQTS